jgi:hypothetical protein
VSHSAKRARHTVHRQKPSLPSTCSRALGKEKQPLRRRVTETTSLPSVCLTALGKEFTRVVPISGTLPSAWYGTRQSVLLCRVPEPLQSAKNLYRCPGLGSLPSAMVLTLGKVTSTHLFICFPYSIQTNKIYFTYITYIHHRSSHTYIANRNNININSDIS